MQNTTPQSNKNSSTAPIEKNHSNIKLTEKQFESFKEACNNPSPIPTKLKETAKLLDIEGF